MRIGIIGGGPGEVAAATLARGGHEVHLIESEVFPRFHIGESLLPCNLPVYEDIGLPADAFTTANYQPKHAAHFELSGSGRTCRFPFADGLPGDPPAIFQVERARFDAMLLTNAVKQGARLQCPATVVKVTLPETTTALPELHIEDAGGGNPRRLTVDFVIDASGRETLIARQLGLLDREGDLMRAAVYGHVGAIPLAPGAERGDISIAKGAAGWAWAIPLESASWSVGLVLKREVVVKGGGAQCRFLAIGLLARNPTLVLQRTLAQLAQRKLRLWFPLSSSVSSSASAKPSDLTCCAREPQRFSVVNGQDAR